MILGKKALYDALHSLCHLAGQQITSHFRGHVLLIARDDGLELLATDGASWLRVSLKCDGQLSACLPAKPLLEFLRPCDAADAESIVEFKTVENCQVVVAVEGAMITLPALSVDDFPQSPIDSTSRMKKVKSWCIPDFRDAIAWVLLAVGLDETRPMLTGVLFDSDCVVAVDGHRLHRAWLGGFGAPTIVSGCALGMLLRVLPKTGVVELFRGRDLLVFRASDWELVAKPLDVEFPPYKQVIPAASQQRFHAVVQGALLRAALRRFPRSSLGSANSIRLKVNGAVEVSASGDASMALTTIPVTETTHTGRDFCISVNADYLRDAVAKGGDEVALHFSDELDPIVVRPAEDKLAIIMPMRV